MLRISSTRIKVRRSVDFRIGHESCTLVDGDGAMWAREANTGLSYNGSSAPFTETRSSDTLETHKPAA